MQRDEQLGDSRWRLIPSAARVGFVPHASGVPLGLQFRRGKCCAQRAGAVFIAVVSLASSGCALGPWHEVKVTRDVRSSERQVETARQREVLVERSAREIQVSVREQVRCEVQVAAVRVERVDEERDYNAWLAVYVVGAIAGAAAPLVAPAGNDENGDGRAGLVFVTLPLTIVLVAELARQTERTTVFESAPTRSSYRRSCPAQPVASERVELLFSDGTKRVLRTASSGQTRAEVAPEVEVTVQVAGAAPRVSPAFTDREAAAP